MKNTTQMMTKTQNKQCVYIFERKKEFVCMGKERNEKKIDTKQCSTFYTKPSSIVRGIFVPSLHLVKLALKINVRILYVY